MLPKEIHIKTIEDFHNTLIKVNELIDSTEDNKIQLELLMEYRSMIKLWSQIDNVVDLVKCKLDNIKNK